MRVTRDVIVSLLAHSEEEGCICMSELERLTQEHELNDDQVSALYQDIEERGLEITDDCCREDAPAATYVNGDLVHATTDALQLFLNEAGRYKLLHTTAAAPPRHAMFARLHSITSSARASKVCGTAIPSALAVLRLITSSYLVGACTGRPAGFSPLRMRST